ncbi:hypothetical protein CBR_g50352 [Chara braunii]|uniref:Uncharacterized protein n=1 Tax=Chara braunii TaxID=69332 RepID=A0A388K5T6_CHABU|nr:hypothetical protein CBR_g50352 [Chara braunii]|eukprot:GBG65313.1 hypothetical protein CBR_g50352 [Chara braunii]
MLVPYLLWSTCMKFNGGNSSGHYLVIDVPNLTLWDPIVRRVEIREEENEEEVKEEREEASQEEEEENSEVESDNPDYNESEESGLDESDNPSEQDKEEDEAAAQKRRKRAEGKRAVEESDGPAARLPQGDPARNPESPQEELRGHGVTTAEGSIN